jgi:hypothetical protein
VYFKTNDTKAAFKLIAEMREAFQKSPEAELRASYLEEEIYRSQNNQDLADKAYANIQQLTQQITAMPKDLLLDIAETHFLVGNAEAGNKLIGDLICNYADDKGFIDDIVQRHKAVSKDEHYAEDLFKRTKQELIEINNQGVNLFKQGNVSAAFDILEGAYKRMPNNKTIIMNFAKILLRDMKTSGITRDKLLKIKALIAKAVALGVAQDKTGFIKMELSKLMSSKTNQQHHS